MTGSRILDFFIILICVVIAVIVLFKLIDVLDDESAAVIIPFGLLR